VGPVRVEQDLAVQVDAADLGVDEPLRFGEPQSDLVAVPELGELLAQTGQGAGQFRGR
jgi:hypothetical protein